MHITSKGQITIPQQFREEFGFLPNTEVQFEVVNKELVVRKAKKSKNARGKKLVKSMRGAGDIKVKMSTDEIMSLMRS